MPRKSARKKNSFFSAVITYRTLTFALKMQSEKSVIYSLFSAKNRRGARAFFSNFLQ
ncbi:hypothetical protein PM8797T_05820 [Gimesia maris DSM 8797]|nr:hypothetical protein PM8797T_05820 [Gimesia maris DSM 8797]